jgi:PII-like signaling protein
MAASTEPRSESAGAGDCSPIPRTTRARCLVSLVTQLLKAGAAGATVVQGHLGFALGDPMRPDRGSFICRKAPMVTTLIDTNVRIARWFEIVDALTGDHGLVTSEPVTLLRPSRARSAEASSGM